MSLVPPVDTLVLPDRRRATDTVHETLRGMILSGILPGGAVISQVKLSQDLGVSRTPLREALRMLKEEGLVEAEPNRRTRISSFDAESMDSVYGVRLILESLGMRLTLPTLTAATLDLAEQSLHELEQLEEKGGPTTGAAWQKTHHDFHHFFISGAPQPLIEQIDGYAQRSERYIYLAAHAHVDRAGSTAISDHRRILALARAGETQETIVATAFHRARTALIVLADLASEVEPVAIRAAMASISSEPLSAPSGARQVTTRRQTSRTSP